MKNIYILIKRHKLVYYFYKKTNFFNLKKKSIETKRKEQTANRHLYVYRIRNITMLHTNKPVSLYPHNQSNIHIFGLPNFLGHYIYIYIYIFFFLRVSFNLWCPLLMITLYHQTKTLISF